MIYLDSETREFTKTKQQFEEAYIAHLERMLETYRSKGASRDTGSPIHHRHSPEQMLGVIQAKGHRLDALFSGVGWQYQSDVLDKVVEECIDQANYALYIAALCSMLLEETKQ